MEPLACGLRQKKKILATQAMRHTPKEGGDYGDGTHQQTLDSQEGTPTNTHPHPLRRPRIRMVPSSAAGPRGSVLTGHRAATRARRLRVRA